MVFDKTGTLTQGRFAVEDIRPAAGIDAATLLRYAAGAESFSSHPIAKALTAAAQFLTPPSCIPRRQRKWQDTA